MAKRQKHVHHAAPNHLLTEEEQEERQANYLARLEDVTATCANFKHFVADFKELEGQRADKDSWDQYMQCDALPDVKSPIEIRTFLSKIRHFEDLEAAKSIDWTLAVDERSVLTQNIFQKDLTRKVLEKSACTSPGPYFEVNLGSCLELLRQVDYLMDNEVEVERMGQSRQIDILGVCGEIRREIESIFDRLTYRVLAMQKATMKSVDGIVAMWSHSCDRWRMDLWGLLNVPIISKQMEVPARIVEFPATGVQVQLPQSILTDCLTLRCVHTRFDHLTQNAKSFEHAAIDHNDMSYIGIVDMVDSAMAEWNIQNEIQEEVLMAMRRKREEYEELMQLIAERTEKAAKNSKSKNDGEKIFIPKTPKEVPFVPPNMYPEVYNEFISSEKKHYEDYMENCLHPKFLNMMPNEINLREYIIIGGIYSLMFVEAPGQTQFQNFNIVLHHDRRVLRLIPDVVAKETIGKPRISEETRTTFEGSFNRDDNELPYFIVTVKLPPDLCKWDKPRVCHFLNEPQRASRVFVPSLRTSVFDNHRGLSSCIEELPLSITCNRNSSVVKSLTQQSNCLQRDKAQMLAKDISLDKILDNDKSRSLKTYCLPSIISSFRFPQELNEEDAVESPPKIHLTWKKRTETPDKTEVALQEDNYDYSMQDQPERMFPMFPNVLPVQFLSDCKERSACGLVSTINNIKKQYEEKPQNILQQVETLTKEERKLERSDDPEILSDDLIVQEHGTKKTKPSSAMAATSQNERRTRKNRPKASSFSRNDDERDLDLGDPVIVTHWTTRHIIDESYDPTTATLTIKTDRLGMLGLAFKRYEHFPFGEWCLQPNENNPDEIILSLNTQHVGMFFYITSQGVRGYVTDLSKGYVAHPVKYLNIKEPISDFRQLRQTFVDNNFNIFPEKDASFYISHGYNSVKHLATEMHTYNTMALYCKSMKFYRSSWNRLAERRNLLMNMKIAKDTSEFTEVTARITPEKTSFVKVSEMCSDNINDVRLHYEGTWRNVGNYVDLNSAIVSLSPAAPQESCKPTTMLFIYTKRLLSEIRPLSFS